jgi:hypothetical protein
MKIYGGVALEVHIFLSSAVGLGQLLASHLRRINSEKMTSDTQWLVGRMGLRTDLGVKQQRKSVRLPEAEFRSSNRIVMLCNDS